MIQGRKLTFSRGMDQYGPTDLSHLQQRPRHATTVATIRNASTLDQKPYHRSEEAHRPLDQDNVLFRIQASFCIFVLEAICYRSNKHIE